MRSAIVATVLHPSWTALGSALIAAATLVWIDGFTSPPCGGDGWCPTVGDLRRGEALPEAIHIHDRDGALFADVAGPARLALDAARVPPEVAAAFVAVEDRRFFEHGGVDGVSVLRALARNVAATEVRQGASTIAMQLVRTLWAEHMRDVGPWRRKVIEARTAPVLVRALGRERLLTTYLNAIYLGNGVYGVGEAARYYFGTSVDSLGLAELATLVGMTRAPERYDPRHHPERSLTRRRVVLEILRSEGLIGPAEADAAGAAPLTLAPERRDRYERDYVTAAVTRTLRDVAPEVVGMPGIRVFTTLDSSVQARGREALLGQLEAIEAGRHGRPLRSAEGAPLQGAAVALDAATGAVRGWIGGRDFGDSEFDRVQQARRPIGSLVKPFVVAHSLERGLGIVDLISSDTVLPGGESLEWMPADHVEERVLPMREALIRSSNRASVHLGRELGLGAIREVGHRVGLEGPIPAVPSAYIGAFDASLLEMTAAFIPFGNGGYAPTPYLVERVESPGGDTLWRRLPPDSIRRVFDARTSWVVLDALRDVVLSGTATGVRAAGYVGPAAGKTGTSDGGHDAWFVGLTPELVAGVWVGYDAPAPIVSGGSGGLLAAPVWGRWMRRLPPRDRADWTPPPGVVAVRYDIRTGRVVERTCTDSGDELRTAWVQDLRYVTDRCRTGLRGWLDGIWRQLNPVELKPVTLESRKREGG